ncbi:hypothetical protein C5167_018029 [Papaver somniferum]|uniref:BED-type domain-containing protein n=1 Tax=Papaver somniferum TaxID=3469 RepID=A0A4Y7IL37_PAPSO|nr:hypothetical protein C5167_018029 [Papaver somniferum]
MGGDKVNQWVSFNFSILISGGNMKIQTGSSVGGHCVPVKKTKVTVLKSPCMPPPKAAVSKAAKKSKVVNSAEPKEVETVASESSDSGDSDHIEAATTDVVLSPTRKRKRTSKYWAEFQEVLIKGKTHGECKHCKRNIGAESKNGTSSLRKHLNSCMAYKGAQQQINQMFLKASETQDGSVAAYNFKFNQEVTRDCIARMIILHELPFSFIEYIGFRRVLTSLQPNIKLVKRNITKSDCIKIYQMEKKHLYEIFSKVQSRIRLTTDIWTCTTQNRGYMALTSHYVDEEWKIQKIILSFNAVDGQHTGVNIAKVLMEQLYKWNIDRKIASITLDNASTNKVVVSELLAQLKPDNGLLLDGELFDVLLIGSPQRQQKFKEVCLQVNAPDKKLIQDVDTRWNSTYLMLETALLFREAFNRFGKIEPHFLNVAPTSEDWKNASSLSICLKFFYEVTILFSELREWCDSDDALISKMAVNMMKNEDKKLEVMEVLKRLYNEYATHYASSAHVYSANISTNQVNMKDSVGSSGSTSYSQSSFTSRRKGLTAFLEESSQHDVVRTDLEQYLSADVHPIRKGSGIDLNDSSFDVLGWWKFHGPMYPIVAVIARDILAIPASSVASESVFSTNDRVVDKFRSSMLPKTIEALICTQDWIRSALKNEGFGLGSTSLQTLLEAMEELESDDNDATSHIV